MRKWVQWVEFYDIMLNSQEPGGEPVSTGVKNRRLQVEVNQPPRKKLIRQNNCHK